MKVDVTGRCVFIVGKPDSAAYADAERVLYEEGALYVFNPLERFKGAEDYRDYSRKALHMLTSDAFSFDCLVMLDGWNTDTFSHLAVNVATQCGMQIFHLFDVGPKAAARFMTLGGEHGRD